MHAVLLLVATTLPGIDVGWIQLPDGSYEYIIQIEPEMLDRLRDGQDLRSDLPPALRNVSRYQIRVGNEPVPHEGVPPELVGKLPRSDAATARAAPQPLDGPFLQLPRSEWPGPGADVQLVNEQPAPAPIHAEEESVVVEEPTEPVEEAPANVLPRPQEIAVEAPPQPFTASSTPKPLVEQAAVFDHHATEEEPPAEEEETVQPSLVGKPPVPDEPQKPWWALSLALLALFASLGGNAYLAWITWDTRLRYRSLLDRRGVREPAAG